MPMMWILCLLNLSVIIYVLSIIAKLKAREEG